MIILASIYTCCQGLEPKFLCIFDVSDLLHLCPLYIASVNSSSICTTTLSWVSACSNVVEHFQQGGFTECRCQRHVNPQIGGESGI
jgi:hypothetical protein